MESPVGVGRSERILAGKKENRMNRRRFALLLLILILLVSLVTADYAHAWGPPSSAGIRLKGHPWDHQNCPRYSQDQFICVSIAPSVVIILENRIGLFSGIPRKEDSRHFEPLSKEPGENSWKIQKEWR